MVRRTAIQIFKGLRKLDQAISRLENIENPNPRIVAAMNTLNATHETLVQEYDTMIHERNANNDSGSEND